MYARRQRFPNPTYSDLLIVAKDAIETLRRLGIDCCLMGSMACKVYGTSRLPNDVDILCLNSPYDQEELKRKLVQLEPKFYLVRARDPTATYKVLWCKVQHLGYYAKIKVDLLYPGVLDIPEIPVAEIDVNNTSRLPCLPLSPLLLLKLQGWTHHGESIKEWERLKQPADAQDIKDLLRICRRKSVRPRVDPHIPTTFQTISESRVARFVDERPESESDWTELGFSIE